MVPPTALKEPNVRPLKRSPKNRNATARGFSKKTRSTKAANLQGLQRGGWRL